MVAQYIIVAPSKYGYFTGHSGIFRKLLFYFAIFFMLFAQIEGTFDDIPQIVHTISKALSSSGTFFSNYKTSELINSFSYSIIAETDDEDDPGPVLHSLRFIFGIVLLGLLYYLSYLHAAQFIESGTRKDKSPPSTFSIPF